MNGERRQGDHRPDPQAAVFLFDDRIEPRHFFQVHHLRRRQQAFLEEIEKIDAAGLDDGYFAVTPAVRSARSSRWPRSLRPRPQLRQSFWHSPRQTGSRLQLLCGTLPSAASTAAGVIGMLRRRTPIAL